jgi:hypothetical protein
VSHKSSPEGAPTLFAAALPPKPPGKDFFLVAIVIDTPDDPYWNEGFDIVGAWEQVDQTFSDYVARGGVRRKHTISIYQGEAARAKLVEGMKEEARYQQQMQAQPHRFTPGPGKPRHAMQRNGKRITPMEKSLRCQS